MTKTVNSSRGHAGIPLSICLVLVFASVPARAKTGGMSGTVRDPSDDAIGAAFVTLTNQDTNTRRTQNASNSGFYSFPNLQPALYPLEVEAPGFKRFVRTNIAVNVEHNVAIDPKLEIGQTADSVTLSADTSLLQTNTSSLCQLVSYNEILDLPCI